MARMMDAFAAAEPAMRRSLDQMEREIGAAMRDARRDLPPPEVDEDWDADYEDEPEED
jgi:hypothetical protein